MMFNFDETSDFSDFPENVKTKLQMRQKVIFTMKSLIKSQKMYVEYSK